jgi:apolipoprotein N-acyltransferase
VSATVPATGRPLRAWLLGALAVALTVAALPPFGLWPLALLAAGPATAFVLQAPSPRRAALRGWLYGAGTLGLGTFWLAETLWLNLVLVALVGAMWHAAWGWACRRVLPAGPLLPAAPLLWVAMEMARLNWPLSGYPWVFLGHALAASPVLVQVADLGGVLLVSLVAATTGTAFLALRRGERRAAGAAGLVLASAALYGVIRPGWLPEGRDGPRLATIQPAFPQQLKVSSTAGPDRHAACMRLSDQALALEPQPDVLVWPETMWYWPLGEGSDDDVWYPADRHGPALGPRDAEELSRTKMAPLFRTRRTELVLGSVWCRVLDGRLRLSNSAVAFDAQGRVTGRHDKVLLVPGGEQVPFGDLLPAGPRRLVEDWIRSAAGFLADLEPGPGFEPIPVGGVPCGVTICFENAYGEPSRESVKQGAAFLLNLSNEAWFGTSAEHDQMELQSILRAVETRRALFRSTNSGISCLVRPDGRRPAPADRLLVGGSDRAVAGVFAAQVPLHDGLTAYVRWGDWPGWLGLAGTLLFLVLRRPGRVP